MNRIILLISFSGILFCVTACHQVTKNETSVNDSLQQRATDSSKLVHFPGENHLKNVRQLTFGGDNAEAYWSFDSKQLTFQRTDHQQFKCDQIFFGNVPFDSSAFNYSMVSTGKGRTTCSFFLPGDSLILYASTHQKQDTCPPVPDRKKIGKYVWPVYNTYEIYIADLKGNIRKQLTKNNFYDAEATVSPKGDKIIFTSDRDGDLDLYEMNIDGTNVKRITKKLGYDGGAWFSPDGSKIVWRASRPDAIEEKNQYRRLLKAGMVTPTKMEVWIASADGSDAHQVTDMKGANWAPCFTPDGKKILFASNYEYERGFPFNLYLINPDGTGLEKVTYSHVFDAFPMFSPDGKHLVWCSNRNNGGTHDTNIFIADWVQ
jgi:TolB protein